MSFIIVDVEADGPIPAEYSMVCFGAVVFDDALDKSFYGQTRPLSERFVTEALAVSGFSRQQHLGFNDPKAVMEKFAGWLEQNSRGRPVFVSDNLAFDWQFINYYFHRFLERNPFGFSGRRIGDLYAGLVKDAYKATEWKKYRRTAHTHNPVDDARGNAEALKKFKGRRRFAQFCARGIHSQREYLGGLIGLIVALLYLRRQRIKIGQTPG